ncbi:MAG: competence/damage-inducible protein A [Acidobacteria bacterium]|nr:competence/damage-inducible protein A [Acidobacteriota bacterium]
MVRTAAALIIGNELLSGKIQETNLKLLAEELFGLGVALRRVVICPDEVEVIAGELNALRCRYDVVFTSGGVGPTHDDVTVEAVAQALGRPVVRFAELEELLVGFFGPRLRARHLRMADLPEGAELVRAREGGWPVVKVDNVYVLPGLPEVFRRKLPILRAVIPGSGAFVNRTLLLHCDEGEVADLLDRLVAAHPGVGIGSYPVWEGREFAVRITFDGKDEAAVERAAEALRSALPALPGSDPPQP